MNVTLDFSSLTDAEQDVLAGKLLEAAEARGLAVALPERRSPYTVAEAVRELNVSTSTVYNLAKADRLRVIPGLSVKMLTAESVHALRDGRA